jgi:nucleotide-binding universal stress UspA family protein
LSRAGAAAPAGPDPYELAAQTEERVRSRFEALVQESHMDAQFDAVRASSNETWRALVHEALCADLVVVGKPQDSTEARRDVHRLLTEGGGAVLVLPDAVPAWQGRHVMIAWNASRQAAHAVREAMPLIEQADKVTVVRVRPDEREQGAAKRLLSMLEAHGISECEDRIDAGNLKASDALAARMDTADLLVAGAYGRSRVKEILTGGTTRNLIDQATIPVLMAH